MLGSKKAADGTLIGKERFSFPFSPGQSNLWNAPATIALNNKVRRLLPVRKKTRPGNIHISPVNAREFTPLSKDDMPLIFVVHNGLKYLRSFLKHYRSIGVTRFLCVDDRSDDGTREFLLTQDDVDLYASNVRYREAARSKVWRELLAARYGKNRWFINVDIDEYLFTGRNADLNIRQYANRLFEKGIRRLPAPMIDMVTPGLLKDAVFDGDNDQMPWEVCSHFDGDGYKGYVYKNSINLRGGPRERLYGSAAELMKYPLIYWDDNTSLGVSIHSPKPGHFNHAPVCGTLLHFKIFEDVMKMAEYATKSQQYFQGSLEYQRMYDYFSSNQDKRLIYDGSIKFKDENTLIERGFVAPL